MTRTLRYLLLFVFTGLSGAAFAQGIAGKVLDDKKEPLLSAAIQVYQGGILKGGNITDYDGNYVVKPLDPGYYDVLVLFQGFDSIMIKGVIVSGGNNTTQNFTMQRHTQGMKEFVVKAYKKPLVDQDNPGNHMVTSEEIKVLPTTQVADVVGLAPAIYQKQRGAEASIGGARTTGTSYIIDGVMVQGNVGNNMSQNSVEQLEVITSGISAKYGDVSGGVVNITTRGSAPKLTGNLRLQHSVDGYNNNLASFSLAGPLYKKKVEGGNKKNVLGFSLSGDYYDDHNRNPFYDEQYMIKPEVLKALQANPLKITSDNSGQPVINYASNYITANDLQQAKITPRTAQKEARLNTKVIYQVNDNLSITAGGSLNNSTFDRTDGRFDRTLHLLAADATPTQTDQVYRGYLRFTQKFGKANDTSARHSIISNAYYTVQADFQRTAQKVEDPTFKDNIFKYGYVGKFNQTRTDQYKPRQTDSFSNTVGTILQGSTSTGITYDRSDLNPILANYTTQYMNFRGDDRPLTIGEIQRSAIANGDLPQATYSSAGVALFQSPGYEQNYNYHYTSDQVGLSVDASFDLLLGKTKHAIEFGMYYQQRIQKSFLVYSAIGNTTTLWSQMRQLVASRDNGGLKLDKLNPIFKVNGQQYTYNEIKNGVKDANGNVKFITPGPADTIVYNYQNISQTPFDKNLRKLLGITDVNQDINIDAIDIARFSNGLSSLGLFSADELLNSGKPFVDYYGYTYTGAEQSSSINFNDFWKAKDANGNFTRPVAAFSPNNIAGYIQDKFNYKDIHFNVGVRVERYSANTKVLKDPYSLYPESNISQVPGANNVINGGVHPANLGKDYIVYVDDNHSTNPTVVGYRSGNDWYDPTGKFVSDPRVLGTMYAGGRKPQPMLQSAYKDIVMSDSNFNPNLSFTDYTPQVTVMPRVSFSFPISDVADFYAHYDIYTQRPMPISYGIATAADYYALSIASPNQPIANSNLRPQKTFDYEVGFQQKLSDHAALTITAFYKERKDMINTISVFNAWPFDYQTYGNRDFSTTKGSTILYDLRATNHLRMNFSYTLQFAEGTGSTPTGGRGLLGSIIEAGLPNLRYITALDYDSRHVLAANVDYRYGNGEGPMIAGLNMLQNAGVDFIVRARSGEPYTRYTDAAAQTVIGGVNGSRLPWHFGMDMRIDKDFALSFGNRKKLAVEGVKPKRPLYIKGIVQVNNLLNTREILGVYGYTGRSDDNGYLASPLGQQFVPQQINPQSFSDLYKIKYNDPTYLNYARTISLALEFNF